jgi:CRP/FNR family cyclic AMP-dependent transcriptional regulator
MKSERGPSCGPEALCLAEIKSGKTILHYGKKQVIFRQGDPADALFYVCEGKVKLGITSKQGKEAVIALLVPGDFFGEGCLADQQLRTTTASAILSSMLLRLDKAEAVHALRDNPGFSAVLLSNVLARSIRIEEDLVDQLFNSSEKRLARVLLRMANFGKDAEPEPVVLKISQETLAEMIGTTRSRVNLFMNKFRREGLIHYNGGITVHPSLMSILLTD